MNHLYESAAGHSLVTRRALHNADVDAQAAALIYERWEQRYDQLSSGRFDGSVQEMRFPSFTLIRETSNRVLLQKGCTPQGVFAIGTLITMGESGYHCGELMANRTAALLEPGTEFEIRTPERFDLVAAVFSPRDLAANLDAPASTRTNWKPTCAVRRRPSAPPMPGRWPISCSASMPARAIRWNT